MKLISEREGNSVYLFAILGNLAMQMIVSVIVLIAGKSVSENSVFNFIMMIFIQAVYFFVVYTFIGRKKISLKYSLKNKVTPMAAVLAVVAASVCIFGFYGVATWFDVFLQRIGYQSMSGINFDSAASIVVGAVAVCLIAPFCEELVFRGALGSGLMEKGNVFKTIALSGLAFSLMHMNPEQTVYQFLLGCVCAYIMICSGSVVCAMIIHSVSNLWALLLSVTPLGNAFGNFIIAMPLALQIVLTVVTALVSAVLVYIIGRLTVKFSPKVNHAEHKPVKYAGRPVLLDGSAEAQIPQRTTAVEEDETQYGSLGKSTSTITFVVASLVCMFMWVTIFISSMI